MLIAAIAMIAARPEQRSAPGQPVAIENARQAANRGLTILTATVLSAAYILVGQPCGSRCDQGRASFPDRLGIVVAARLSVMRRDRDHRRGTVALGQDESSGRPRFRSLAPEGPPR